MMDKKTILSTFAVCLSVIACGGHGNDNDDEITTAVDSFATAYFNYDFKAAIRHSTPESEKWLRFAASNILDEDIELLRAQDEGATHSVDSISYQTDSTATAVCKVHNYVRRDTLGKPARLVKECVYYIDVVRKNGRWTVDASSPKMAKE